jgi:hypothetical protein
MEKGKIYSVSAKIGDKWVNGRLSEGKYGWQIGIKNTPELKELVANGGEWINFNVKEKVDKQEDKPKEATKAPVYDDSQDIPF